MKIVLIKDVKGIGSEHDTVDVADGHALNYLIPKGFAKAATPQARKEAELRLKQKADHSALEASLLAQNIASLAEAHIVIRAKANEKGHLYDAIGEREIVQAAKEQAHVDISKDAIRLEKPIKALGTFDVPVATANTFGRFSVTVEAEE